MIILFVLNDPEFRGYALKPLINIRSIEPLLQRSHLYYYFVRSYNIFFNPYDEYIKKLYEEGSDTAEYCQKTLKEFGKLSKWKKKFFLILAICPIIYDFDQYPFKDIHKKVALWGKQSGMNVIDLLPAFTHAEVPANKLRASSQDWHPNTQGHKIIADSLTKPIIAYLDSLPVPKE